MSFSSRHTSSALVGLINSNQPFHRACVYVTDRPPEGIRAMHFQARCLVASSCCDNNSRPRRHRTVAATLGEQLPATIRSLDRICKRPDVRDAGRDSNPQSLCSFGSSCKATLCSRFRRESGSSAKRASQYSMFPSDTQQLTRLCARLRLGRIGVYAPLSEWQCDQGTRRRLPPSGPFSCAGLSRLPRRWKYSCRAPRR